MNTHTTAPHIAQHVGLPTYVDIANESVVLRRTADGYETPDGRYQFIRTTYASSGRNGCWKDAWHVHRRHNELGFVKICTFEDRLKDCRQEVFYDLVGDLPEWQQNIVDQLVAA
jgi:hypothetical protein